MNDATPEAMLDENTNGSNALNPPQDWGLEALSRLIQDLGLAGPALARSQRGFSWQGPRLRLDVRAEPMRSDAQQDVCRLSSRTPVLIDAPNRPALREYLDDLNRGTAMGAWSYDPASREVALCASVQLRAADRHFWETWFLLALALQIAQADAQLEDLGAACGGRPAVSSALNAKTASESPRNPSLDPASTDPLQSVVVEILHAGQADLPFDASALSEAALAESSRWILPMADARGLSALLPFDPTMRVGDFFAEVEAGGENPNCARLRLDLAQPHPSLGAGLLCLLKLPTATGPSGGGFDAPALNLAAAREGAGLSQIGAWCEGDRPTFVAFLPMLLLLAAEDAIVEGIQSLLAELSRLVERIVAT